MGKQKKTTSGPYEVRISVNALLNIDEITGYIAFIAHSPQNAIKAGDAILETIDRISKNPVAFRECEQLRTNTKKYRRALCMAWQIIFRVSGNSIVILGIIHSSRRPSEVKKLRRIT
ncbi:MAG: type II toxin-antitoxin system RelE/ParE family toxin [Flavipsychrobacter sp.]|nr:type II toxin-antitoxin system RelE/ParE family toxin [Flavipsychrobacter sp.]